MENVEKLKEELEGANQAVESLQGSVAEMVEYIVEMRPKAFVAGILTGVVALLVAQFAHHFIISLLSL